MLTRRVMACSIDVEASEPQQRLELDDEPLLAALDAEADYEYFCDDGCPGSEAVKHTLTPAFDAVVSDAVSEQLHGGDCSCKRRQRSASPNTGYADDKLFPVPVGTSSRRPPAVTWLMWLPLLLSMTSCVAAALPVDHEDSRVPLRVFDGSSNTADVDGPVTKLRFQKLRVKL